MTPEPVRLVLASRIVWLDVVQTIAEDLASLVGLDEDGRFAVSMALREGVNNAIVHGNRRDETKEIEVVLVPHSDRLEIRIKDEGTGFDHQGLPDPLSPQNLLASSGRGVFLIKSYMDDVDLSRAGAPGGEIRMSKWLPGAAPGKSA